MHGAHAEKAAHDKTARIHRRQPPRATVASRRLRVLCRRRGGVAPRARSVRQDFSLFWSRPGIPTNVKHLTTGARSKRATGKEFNLVRLTVHDESAWTITERRRAPCKTKAVASTVERVSTGRPQGATRNALNLPGMFAGMVTRDDRYQTRCYQCRVGRIGFR
jgi:hypothetical protein